MLLRHATLARNLNSILRRGLLCSKSRGKPPVVWASFYLPPAHRRPNPENKCSGEARRPTKASGE